MEMCATGDCITFAHICIQDSIQTHWRVCGHYNQCLINSCMYNFLLQLLHTCMNNGSNNYLLWELLSLKNCFKLTESTQGNPILLITIKNFFQPRHWINNHRRHSVLDLFTWIHFPVSKKTPHFKAALKSCSKECSGALVSTMSFFETKRKSKSHTGSFHLTSCIYMRIL